MTRALEGLKVLDLSMNLPGPYMTWLLALLGAEVVKVENPEGGDYARALGGKQNSPLFEAVNRNKKSVTLNMQSPEGREMGRARLPQCGSRSSYLRCRALPVRPAGVAEKSRVESLCSEL